MKIPTADQLLVYIVETTLAIHVLNAADLPAATGSLEYKLKGDVTLFIAMYGEHELARYWCAIAEACTMLYDLRIQPLNCDQIDPRADLETLRARIRRRTD
jgi:hypothetical protein